METIILDNMMKFFEDNEILYISIYGFRSKCSGLTNSLDVFDYMFDVYEESKSVDVIYLDFQKAFDKVPHKRLLNKND